MKHNVYPRISKTSGEQDGLHQEFLHPLIWNMPFFKSYLGNDKSIPVPSQSSWSNSSRAIQKQGIFQLKQPMSGSFLKMSQLHRPSPPVDAFYLESIHTSKDKTLPMAANSQ
jgi:hypothetical protein